MIKKILLCVLSAMLILGVAGCAGSAKKPKIGVSFGVGAAVRWPSEKAFMEKRAEELGVEIEARLNTDEAAKPQLEDCKELIDSGIDVLIYTPRDAEHADDVLDYAKSKNVKVINYARVVLGNDSVDLFVGYDSRRIGQMLGQYLSELVYEGDYILLSGDEGDFNAKLLNDGAMVYIDPIRPNVNVILESAVAGWSPEEAEAMVKEAVAANGNSVDAILAPNDKIAGGCAAALEELGVEKHVVITGMDAELDALKRIVAGKQDVTMYMNLEELARKAVDEAYDMAMGKAADVNAKFDNNTAGGIEAYLIAGQLVTAKNIDKIIVDGGVFTKEEIYGE